MLVCAGSSGAVCGVHPLPTDPLPGQPLSERALLFHRGTDPSPPRVWFENTWRYVLHPRHHACGSWGPGPSAQVRCQMPLLARCGPVTVVLCRHVDNSTSVHRHRPVSTPRPWSMRRVIPTWWGLRGASTGAGGRLVDTRGTATGGDHPPDLARREGSPGAGGWTCERAADPSVPNLCTELGTRRQITRSGERTGAQRHETTEAGHPCGCPASVVVGSADGVGSPPPAGHWRARLLIRAVSSVTWV
jgi:hypothetical protein